MTPILQLVDLNQSFGAVKVADGISFEVNEGEALGVIGPNGAGKTSMFNLITGTLTSQSGRIFFNGDDISQFTAAARSRLGVARSFQVPQPFGRLTVFENAMVAATQSAGLRGRAAEDLCVDVLDRTGLLQKANSRARNLTLLERKRLELARALCTKARLLLLDEIAGGLTEAECNLLVRLIKEIKTEGTTIVWIEHVVHALLEVVDRLV
ncbi:MAG: ABC transporter ATP-binding protein, partial [Hyphomicrobiaceae bacterium]